MAVLVLNQDVIEEDGKVWMRYRKYSAEKGLPYQTVITQAHRGSLKLRVIFGKTFVSA